MKKVLSFVLILALVLGSFSFAFGLTDIEDSANTDAINVSNNLGIIDGFPDGTFKPAEAVNRAQFAKMVTRALGVPDSALAGFTATKFKDTSGYGWAVPYLAFCDSKGIILGDGMGNAMPGRTINLNEAVTMVLRAVGYTANSAELVGTWPANYVTMAQDKGLYDDVASMATVDRANAAQVLYNALTLTKVQVAADGTTDYVTGNPTMLTAGLECSQVNGGYAYVLKSGDADTAVMSAQKYIGAYVKAFKNSDGDIVAIEEVSTFLTGEYNQIDKVFKADGVEYNFVTSSALTYEWKNNGTTTNSFPFKVNNGVTGTTTNAIASDTAFTLAVNLSGKTIKEVYSIATWDQQKSFKFETSMLDKDSIDNYKFPLDDNKAIDNSMFILVGVSSLEDIAVDDVVTVYLKGGTTGTEIVKVAVSNEKVTGTITQIYGNDYTLDGKVYERATSATDDIDIGDTGTAFIDHKGYIAFWDVEDGSSDNYAMFMATDSSVTFGKTVVKVKMFDKTGAEITPECKDDVTGNAITIYNKVSGAAVNMVTNGAIVKFALDSSGKVKTLTSAAVFTNGLTGKTAKSGTLIGTTPVDKSVVVFLLNSDDEFEIGKIADFDTDKDFSLVSHTAVKGDNGKIKAIAALKSDIVSGGDFSYGVVNSTGKAISNDTTYLSYKGLMNGLAFTTRSDNETLTGFVTTTSSGLVQFSINADGIITKAVTGTSIEGKNFVSSGALDKTVSSISGNELKMSNDARYIAAEGAVVYLWDYAKSEWKIADGLRDLKGKYVNMYTTDTDKVTGFDIILAW